MKLPTPQRDLPPTAPRPLWETIVIAASFGCVWIYLLAWIVAGRSKETLSPWWQLLLAPCVIVLFLILRRRLKRAREVLQEDAKSRLRR